MISCEILCFSKKQLGTSFIYVGKNYSYVTGMFHHYHRLNIQEASKLGKFSIPGVVWNNNRLQGKLHSEQCTQNKGPL